MVRLLNNPKFVSGLRFWIFFTEEQEVIFYNLRMFGDINFRLALSL